MKQRLLITLAVAAILGTAMVGLHHIDRLNDGIKLKEIELQDNSLRLKLLDKKYEELNKNLEKTGADKAKVEEQLKQLQIERDKLEKDLQAKAEAKKRDIAAQAQKAVVAAVETPKAYASNCGDAKSCIYAKESGNNPSAINRSSGACGLGQAWPCSKLRLSCSLTDYECQDAFFTKYAVDRYGSWDNAWSFWQLHNWW